MSLLSPGCAPDWGDVPPCQPSVTPPRRVQGAEFLTHVASWQSPARPRPGGCWQECLYRSTSLGRLKEVEEVWGLLFKAELTPGDLCSGDSLGMSLERSPAALRLSLPAWSTSAAPGDSP